MWGTAMATTICTQNLRFLGCAGDEYLTESNHTHKYRMTRNTVGISSVNARGTFDNYGTHSKTISYSLRCPGCVFFSNFATDCNRWNLSGKSDTKSIYENKGVTTFVAPANDT